MDVKEIARLDFEDGYTRLEQVIQRLEAGNLSLEESVALYEEGVCLAKHCSQKLDDAEIRVSQLLESIADRESPSAAAERL